MNKLAIIAVAGIAAAAGAQNLSSGNGTGSANGAGVNLLDYATVTYSNSRDVGYSTVTITFNTDIPSWDLEGDADNFIANIDFGVAGTIHGIGWDTTQASIGASWLSEMVVSFADLGGAPGLYLTPSGTTAPGTESYSSGGIVDLEGAGIPDVVIASGVLSMEFFESFDDVADAIDGNWLEGSTITLDMFFVPAPGALALLGLGGLVSTRRRR